jgi:hypothetical protein
VVTKGQRKSLERVVEARNEESSFGTPVCQDMSLELKRVESLELAAAEYEKGWKLGGAKKILCVI